jgi:hypothetical protein
VDDVDRRVIAVQSELDPLVTSGSLSMAGAITRYLSYRRDELNADDAKLIRLAVRAEWKNHPPDVVARWLAERGLTP